MDLSCKTSPENSNPREGSYSGNHVQPPCEPGFNKLNVTQKRHAENRKSHKCYYANCTKTYVCSASLEKHIFHIHLRERPYACKLPGCEKKYANVSSLNFHTLSAHGGKNHLCEFCGSRFAYNCTLKAHITRSHKLQAERVATVTEPDTSMKNSVSIPNTHCRIKVKKFEVGSVEPLMQVEPSQHQYFHQQQQQAQHSWHRRVEVPSEEFCNNRKRRLEDQWSTVDLKKFKVEQMEIEVKPFVKIEPKEEPQDREEEQFFVKQEEKCFVKQEQVEMDSVEPQYQYVFYPQLLQEQPQVFEYQQPQLQGQLWRPWL